MLKYTEQKWQQSNGQNRHFKKGTVAILVVLILQAYCDLSLPAYTSDIVNVGIQQSGIDETVPDAISTEKMDKVLLFVTDEDEKQEVLDAYEKDVDIYKKEAYVLKENVQDDEEQLTKLSEILSFPMMLTAGFESESGMTQQIEQQIEQQMADMPEMIVEQAAVSYVKTAYEDLGMDMDHIQIQYLLRTGGKMIGLAFLGMAASMIVGFLASRVGASAGRDLRGKVFRKVVGFSNNEFDHFSTAALITRSTNDIQQIQMLIVMLLRYPEVSSCIVPVSGGK